MDEASDAARGRRVLLALIIAILIFDAGVSTLWLSQMPISLDSPRGLIELVMRFGRFLATLLLMLLVYRGSSVAIVITIILFGLAALMAVPATLENPFLFPMLVLFGAFPIVLMFSEDVGAFLEGQRSRRRSISNQVFGPASDGSRRTSVTPPNMDAGSGFSQTSLIKTSSGYGVGLNPQGDFLMDTPPDAARGRTILLVLIIAVLASSALIISIYLALMPASLSSPKGQLALATRAVRFLLTVLLMLFVYRGSSVAKWICIILFGLAMLISIPAALVAPVTIPLIFVYGAFAYCLLFSADVLEFLEGQRSGRRLTDKPEQPPS